MKGAQRFYLQLIELADGGHVWGIWDSRQQRLAWRDAVGTTWIAATREAAERKIEQWNTESAFGLPLEASRVNG